MARVLIIDDDPAICRMTSEMVKKIGHEAETAMTLQGGVEEADKNPYDVILLDVQLPDGSGLEAISRLRGSSASPEVIIITGLGDPDGAEMAVRNGAWDYIQKPFSLNSLILPLKRVFQYRDELAKRQKPAVALKLDGIIGSSSQIKTCFDYLAQAANSEANVLITGETGTGKELFARAVHANGPRADRNFVVVDCAALPETLVESSLFGHVRGAFTGADRASEGLIKQADKGTLFLDEVGELPISIQRAFLRVLQERTFRPVGGKSEVSSEFRLIAATNRDLDTRVKDGKFRIDLLYRLRSLQLELPPLRQRQEDIRDMVLFYTAKICERYATEIKGFSPEYFDALTSYAWPGNVRELINALEGSITEAGDDPTLYPKHLPSNIRIQLVRASVKEKREPPSKDRSTGHFPSARSFAKYREFRESVLAEAEKKYLQDLMTFTKGSIKDACAISGLGRTRLYTLLKKYGITRLGWT